MEQLNLQLGVQDVSLVRGNPTTLPAKVSFVETKERFRVGNSPFQERGVEKSYLNRLGELGLGTGGLSCGPSGLGLREA